MKLATAMLRVASLTGTVVNGTATGGAAGGVTLEDSTMSHSAEKFNGGTVIFTSGTLAGRWTTISTQLGSTLNITPLLALTTPFAAVVITAGMKYALIPAVFSADMLQQAILLSLSEWGDLLTVNKTLTADSGTQVYTLPTGVRDIRRVETLLSDGTLEKNFYWDEELDSLVFSRAPSDGTMYIHYVAPHPDVSETVDIDPLIDTYRLLHSAVANLYGMIVAVKGKDAPMFIELYTRESQIAINASHTDTKATYRQPPRDPHLGW